MTEIQSLLPAASPALLRRLRARLRSLAVGPELLYDLMGFGRFAEMAMTNDGAVIARPHGSAGFDAFIGRLSTATLERTARLWLELDGSERRLVLDRLDLLGIRPGRVGLPETPPVSR